MSLGVGIFAAKKCLCAYDLNTQEFFGFSYNWESWGYRYKPDEDMISEIKCHK